MNLVQQLPPHSRLKAAMADDDELAEQMDLDNLPPPPPPSLTEFDPTTRAIADLYDRMGTLIQVVMASSGSKKRLKMPPYPRPRLAIERVKHRRRMAKHRRLVARLLPHKAVDGEPPAG